MTKARQSAQPARNFLQPVLASKSPVAGLVDRVVPLKDQSSKPPEEIDIIMPFTKRDMMAAAMALVSLPFAVKADDAKQQPMSEEEIMKSREERRKAMCVRN